MTSRLTLANGLRVVHHRVENTAMACVNLGYAAGARLEKDSLTGLAHLMEHEMFGGSAHVEDFDGILQAAGGSSNAWTSDDFTFYHDVIPARNLETAFYLESDRMLAPSFTPESLSVQKGVVTEEFKQQCLNSPYGDLSHHLRGMLYTVHPYRVPVIGSEPAHIERAEREDLLEFFRNYYTPSNAVLTVTGNVDADRVFSLAEKWFSEIRAREPKPFVAPVDPYPALERRKEVKGNVASTRLTLGWRLPHQATDTALAGDILTDILANGRASRFQQMLQHLPALASADACVSGHEDSGYLILSAQMASENKADIDAAVEELKSRVMRLVMPGEITAHETERALNRFRAQQSVRRMSYAELASQLTFEEFRGEDYAAHLRRREAFTPAMLADKAAEIFSAPPQVLIYGPK